jgi:hypothetical protein
MYVLCVYCMQYIVDWRLDDWAVKNFGIQISRDLLTNWETRNFSTNILHTSTENKQERSCRIDRPDGNVYVMYKAMKAI